MVPSLSVFSSLVTVLSHQNGISLDTGGETEAGNKKYAWVFPSLVPSQP